MEMNIKPVFENLKRPVLIAGPCSAETEEQVMRTAEQLADKNIDLFRAGIWKPRTRPNSFEGIGRDGLRWLKQVKETYGLKTTVEVANTQHVFESLKAGVDVLWIGARTTVNPFSVQEVADALEGIDIPVLVKNPINPDLSLWIGAIERLYKAGISRLGIIHRGFSTYGKSVYRNIPRWEIALELKRRYPELQLIVDASHICGNRTLLNDISQQALDLNYDGLMLETHIDPDNAWSDAAQQVTPTGFQDIVDRLIIRELKSSSKEYQENIHELRNQIDNIDREIMHLLSDRMKLSEAIGNYKKLNNISIYQPDRWNEIIETVVKKGEDQGLSGDFIRKVFTAIHEESINHQARIMNETIEVKS